jgi:hypothetical protein
MIKYTLVCDEAHEFESWFRSSEDYETQVKRGFVECPSCKSTKVAKAVMSPNVARRDRGSRGRPEPASTQSAGEPSAEAPQPVALIDDGAKQVRAAIRELHAKLAETSVDVGEKFAEEARRMHEGETPQRSIRGQTSLQEAQALWEEGIPVMPIPTLPEERN